MHLHNPPKGRIRIIDADRLSSSGVAQGGLPWIYAGSRYLTHRKLLRELSPDLEIPFRDVLYNTTYALKDDYIAFIGEMNCRHRDLDWHLSGLSEKNCFVSPAFATICILASVRTLLEGRSDPEILIVCDTPGTAAYLQGLLETAPSGRRTTPRWQVFLRYLPRAVASRLIFVGLGLYRRLVASVFLGKQHPAGRYAILSFVYNQSFRKGYDDVVFGSLIPWLEQLGYDPAIIPLVIPPTSYMKAVRRMRAAEQVFLVPESHEPVGARIRHAFSSLLHPPSRIPPTLFHGIPVEGILEEDLIRDWAGRRALESRALGDSLGRLSADGAFQAITYPFENHVWEKAVCSAVRSESGGTRLIGFQHSTIHSMLINYFISPCESALPFLPHCIITSGSRAHDLLLHSGYPEGMVRSGGAIRFLREEKGAASGEKKDGPFTILVATTVDSNESVELISRVLDTCSGLEGVRIVIRCHPDLPFDRIVSQLERDLPENATTGSGNPGQLREAGVLVFSTTTFAMEALAAGVPVIRITTMDPLTGNRFEGFLPSKMLQFARTDDELRQMVEVLRSSEITPLDRENAQEIVRPFFGPVDESVYALFLPEGVSSD